MKKVIFGLIAMCLFSCGYHKTDEIRYNKSSYQNEYRVWVYDGLELIEGFGTSMDGINIKKKDSINAIADKFIRDCEMLDK